MSTGVWIDGSVPGMAYKLMLPVGYTPTKAWPLVLYLHELGRGTDWTDLSKEVNAWFNPGQVRDQHPCFVLVPLLDQRADPSGVTINYGGVSSTVTAGRDMALACLQQIINAYPIDQGQLILTGSSLGGIGTWEIIAARPDLFAAAMPLAGANYCRDVTATAQALKAKPIWSIHGGQDTSVPLAWDRAFHAATLVNGGIAKYTEDAARGHDVWDYYYPSADLWAWAFAQRLGPPAPPPAPPSPDRSIVLAGAGGGQIIDASSNRWTITSGSQVAVNGLIDATTSAVVELAWVTGVLWQNNTAGKWYASKGIGLWGAGTLVNPLTGLPPPPPPGVGFVVKGGQIIDPKGKAFVPVGVNLNEEGLLAVAVADATCAPLLSFFPGLNCVRIANRSYRAPSYYTAAIANLTAKGVVVLLEDHSGGASHSPLIGSDLTAELTWYSALAAAFASNPYVWFGCYNEPGAGTNLPAIQAQNVAIYQAVRAASKAIVALSLPSGGNKGMVGPNGKGFDGSTMGPANMIATMTGVVWDLHNYGWLSGYSTDPAVIKAFLLGTAPAPTGTGVSAAQLWQSADGVVPVIIGEYGNSTDGTNVDADGTTLCQATIAAGYGGLAWAWRSDGAAADRLTTSMWTGSGYSANPALTPYGSLIAGLISGGSPLPPPPNVTDILAKIDALGVYATAGLAAIRAQVNQLSPPPPPPPPLDHAPAPAAAVGYNTLTFGPDISFSADADYDPRTSYPRLTALAKWAKFAFYGTPWKSIGAVKNTTDGSVVLDGSGQSYGNGLCTATPANVAAGVPWQGIAFGGGAYFQCVMSSAGPMSFWANDIETMAGVSAGTGPNQWPGQPKGFGAWVETDFAEFDAGSVYGGAIHSWYGIVGSGAGTSTVNSGSPFQVPGADYTRPNTYGFLWVPATASAQGYAKWFFNGTQVGNTITWNAYDPSLPPPPIDLGHGGSSAYSVLDKLHLALILGAGANTRFESVQVWQASAANNIIGG